MVPETDLANKHAWISDADWVLDSNEPHVQPLVEDVTSEACCAPTAKLVTRLPLANVEGNSA